MKTDNLLYLCEILCKNMKIDIYFALKECYPDSELVNLSNLKSCLSPQIWHELCIHTNVRDMNEFLKKVDMNQLQETIEKARANTPK